MLRALGLLIFVMVIATGCGGEDSATLSDDEQQRVRDAIGELSCIPEDLAGIEGIRPTTERKGAADDLASIYRDKPEANYKPPVKKNEEPLEEVLKDSEQAVSSCDPGAASRLASARAQVATED